MRDKLELKTTMAGVTWMHVLHFQRPVNDNLYSPTSGSYAQQWKKNKLILN